MRHMMQTVYIHWLLTGGWTAGDLTTGNSSGIIFGLFAGEWPTPATAMHQGNQHVKDLLVQRISLLHQSDNVSGSSIKNSPQSVIPYTGSWIYNCTYREQKPS